MTKLVLIDGNAIIHRAYHALPKTLTDKDGNPINAVYGFVSMLFRVLEDLKPTHLTVCFDTPKPTFRHAAYTGYQAQRPRADSELSDQFSVVFKVLKSMKVSVFSQEGYEADDLIGTVSTQATDNIEENFEVDEVVIVTGDKDILQLVTDRIKVYMPVRGLSNAKLFGKSEVVEKLGVRADQVIDYKALVGDPSDNYKGVSGIGPVTAEKLLKKYNSVAEIYDNLGSIDKRVSTKLAKGAEDAGLSKKLATIVKDAPVTYDPKNASYWEIYGENAQKVFDELGFRSLKKRAAKLAPKIQTRLL